MAFKASLLKQINVLTKIINYKLHNGQRELSIISNLTNFAKGSSVKSWKMRREPKKY